VHLLTVSEKDDCGACLWVEGGDVREAGQLRLGRGLRALLINAAPELLRWLTEDKLLIRLRHHLQQMILKMKFRTAVEM